MTPEQRDNLLGANSAAMARIAELEAELREWHDYFGCSSPHDVYLVNSSTDHMIAGKEQERANRLERENALLRKALEDAQSDERQRAVEICDLMLDRLTDREKCAKAIRDPRTPCPWNARQKAALARIPEAKP